MSSADIESKNAAKDQNGSTISNVQSSATTSKAPQKPLNKLQNIKIEEKNIVRRPFSPDSEKYIRKLDRLVKIYEKMSEKNDKLRYHIVKVKEEVNKLSHIKRHLCCRLSSFNDNYMDENLEIRDTNNRDANFEKLIGEIITNVEPPGPPTNKRRKIEPKKVVPQKQKEIKENSEEPEAREAINRILNDAKSLMKQQQQEQEDMIKSRIQEQKRHQQAQNMQLKQQKNGEKQTKSVEPKCDIKDSGSQSAPVIPFNKDPSISSISQISPSPSQPLNRTMSNPAPATEVENMNQNTSTPSSNKISQQPQYVRFPSSSATLQDGKQIIKNSLPLPQTPGVYIMGHGQQLIKQPSHVQAEMIAKDMKHKHEDKGNTKITTPQKPSSQSYVVTHHELPKNAQIKDDMSKGIHLQTFSPIDGQKINQPQIFIRRLYPSETSPNQKMQQSQPQQRQQNSQQNNLVQHQPPQQHSYQVNQQQGSQQNKLQMPQQQVSQSSMQQGQSQSQAQIQIVGPGPKGPPLQAQITSQPLPNKSQPSLNNQYPPNIRHSLNLSQQQQQQFQHHSQSQRQSHQNQMEQVKLLYTQKQLQDPSTINPQLLPHRQLNAQRLQMEQQIKERERLKRLEEEKFKDEKCVASQHQPQNSQHQQQSQIQPIVIQSSNIQQIQQQIQSQPRLREALQNAGNDTQRQIQLVKTVQGNQTNGQQRLITTKQSPGKAVLQPIQPPQQQQSNSNTQKPQISSQNNVYFIDSSRYIQLSQRDSMNQLVNVQPFSVPGTQAVRYYLPQNISTQSITVTPSPQKSQHSSSKGDDGKFDRLLRASSIDHLLPDQPDNDIKNDDNIDWSVYEEPKPSRSTPKKSSTPRKRGAAIKVDSNSDAMARISPILAKFQQEMAQSTVAQEQQHQQELTMAARNATKPTPVRARKRPSKAEKEATAKRLANSKSSTPVPLTNGQNNSSNGNTNILTDTTVENSKALPSIIVTTATTPESSQIIRQSSSNDIDTSNVQVSTPSQ